MSRISGKETKLEVLVRKFLFSHSLRYRKNVKKLPGTPDIVLHRYNTVIFVHGCFWHGHTNCLKATLPNTNKKFWRQKISANATRDVSNEKKLFELGWHVITIWQCELKDNASVLFKLDQVVQQIKSFNET